ncbi:bacteriocin immunity protein [Streptomyces sp. NBS 14/10]|uniref:bacteriocin immunity protein n=1 Tax=Streptomyces sp. NBS 14/10 TaxID=1945643 RepID=UPI000B7D59D4|nr:bacteriocin immunity protein [Streptomyces sp. NBS 14/10]KAK1180828.1 bacteriocin immunity protein [Streptomyces sp. NBS 14/10]
MTRDELVNLVERVMAGEGTESEHDALVRLLEENVPHPRVLNLIYYSDPPLTAQEVVDKALAYRPIEL